MAVSSQVNTGLVCVEVLSCLVGGIAGYACIEDIGTPQVIKCDLDRNRTSTGLNAFRTPERVGLLALQSHLKAGLTGLQHRMVSHARHADLSLT